MRILPVSPATTIPQMRALAFREAKSEAVAVIEDHVIVPPGWAKRLLACLALDEAAALMEAAGRRADSAVLRRQLRELSPSYRSLSLDAPAPVQATSQAPSPPPDEPR